MNIHKVIQVTDKFEYVEYIVETPLEKGKCVEKKEVVEIDT